MQTVYKYPIKITDEQELQLPKDAQILCVKEQHGEIVLYARVDTANHPVSRTIYCQGTGLNADGLEFADWIDTVLLAKGNLVFHFFADPE